jgi:hypothetical protein
MLKMAGIDQVDANAWKENIPALSSALSDLLKLPFPTHIPYQRSPKRYLHPPLYSSCTISPPRGVRLLSICHWRASLAPMKEAPI